MSNEQNRAARVALQFLDRARERVALLLTPDTAATQADYERALQDIRTAGSLLDASATLAGLDELTAIFDGTIEAFVAASGAR
jgi:hypothetical protein